MRRITCQASASGADSGTRSAFSLVELLVTIAIIAVLASLLAPALSQAREKSRQVFCANNQRQLAFAWTTYAGDNADLLPYNLGATEIGQMLDEHENYNWASSVLTWETEPGNTNFLLNTQGSLGRYLGTAAQVFRCPSDRAVSSVQRQAGWSERCRSISMNAMVGDAGEFTRYGTNVNNPSYKQYLKHSDIPDPSDIFVFIEEHPDSINDGYFLNRAYSWQWTDLPASYHSGGANIAYSDGHTEARRWKEGSTRKPPFPDGAGLPVNLLANERNDFNWLMAHTSHH